MEAMLVEETCGDLLRHVRFLGECKRFGRIGAKLFYEREIGVGVEVRRNDAQQGQHTMLKVCVSPKMVRRYALVNRERNASRSCVSVGANRCRSYKSIVLVHKKRSNAPRLRCAI